MPYDEKRSHYQYQKTGLQEKVVDVVLLQYDLCLMLMNQKLKVTTRRIKNIVGKQNEK
jgi:hypothetical protein